MILVIDSNFRFKMKCYLGKLALCGEGYSLLRALEVNNILGINRVENEHFRVAY